MMDQKARKLALFDPHFPYKSWRRANFNGKSREAAIILPRGLRRWNRNEKYYRLISIYIFDPLPPLSPYCHLTNPDARGHRAICPQIFPSMTQMHSSLCMSESAPLLSLTWCRGCAWLLKMWSWSPAYKYSFEEWVGTGLNAQYARYTLYIFFHL